MPTKLHHEIATCVAFDTFDHGSSSRAIKEEEEDPERKKQSRKAFRLGLR